MELGRILKAIKKMAEAQVEQMSMVCSMLKDMSEVIRIVNDRLVALEEQIKSK